MENNGEFCIYPLEPLIEGEMCLFEFREKFERKELYRKVYFDKHNGLYIMYKGKRYYESEFNYERKYDL